MSLHACVRVCVPTVPLMQDQTKRGPRWTKASRAIVQCRQQQQSNAASRAVDGQGARPCHVVECLECPPHGVRGVSSAGQCILSSSARPNVLHVASVYLGLALDHNNFHDMCPAIPSRVACTPAAALQQTPVDLRSMCFRISRKLFKSKRVHCYRQHRHPEHLVLLQSMS